MITKISHKSGKVMRCKVYPSGSHCLDWKWRRRMT